ncbi:MAG: response regulator [Candidatus Pacebacteria bacterium]|nr:response regulator [Candidatus Paceibacterota bacterium]
MKKSLSTGQLAKYCGVGHRTVLRWIKVGYLDAFQLPGRGDNRVPVEECVRFMKEHGIPIPEEFKEAVKPEGILIVEDDTAMAENLARLFTREGFEVNVVHDGFQAGAMLSEHRPQLMLLDLRLPGLDGIEVLKFVRETLGHSDLKVIVISGLPQADVDKALEAGADTAVRKPFNPQDVVAAAKRLLD